MSSQPICELSSRGTDASVVYISVVTKDWQLRQNSRQQYNVLHNALATTPDAAKFNRGTESVPRTPSLSRQPFLVADAGECCPKSILAEIGRAHV